MDLRHLEQVYEICRLGSFSAAARKLGVSQPTLSKSVARLESLLHVQLFERSGGAVKPTEYGQFLAEGASALLQGSTALRRDLEHLMLGESGALRIGIGPIPRLRLMPDLMRRTTARFPNLQIKLRVGGGNNLARAVNEGRFDIVFCYSVTAPEFGDLIRVKIFEDQEIAAVRPRHPALSAQPLTAAQLMEYPMASLTPGPNFCSWLGKTTAEQWRNVTAFTSDDYDFLKCQAREADYVVRLPRFALEHELQTGELVELPVTWNLTYECWMLTTAACWRSPIVKSIAAFAKDSALRYHAV